MHRSIFLLILISLAMLSQSPAEGKEVSLSIELIHRDLPTSPLYNHSIPPSERMRDAVLRSLNRVNFLHSLIHLNAKDLVSTLKSDQVEYVMKLYIGSQHVEIYAIADTASDLIWIQCAPCYQCHRQDAPYFDPTMSTSYKDLLYGTKFCQALGKTKRGLLGHCKYNYSYLDGSYSLGVLSSETLYLDSTTGETASFPGSIFGCSHQDRAHFSSRVQGVVGLGGGILSLVSQLMKINNIQYLFSYCLQPWYTTSTSQIRFGGQGSKIPKRGVVSSQLVHKLPHTFYYISLKSVSVGSYRTRTSPSQGNIVIDTGTTLTMLHSSMYDDLEGIVKNLIVADPVPDPLKKLSLCYESHSVTYNNFPEMVFHFDGGDLRLPATNVFAPYLNLYCMMIVANDQLSIFGRIAQANFQVEYDLYRRRVSFVSTNSCTTF